MMLRCVSLLLLSGAPLAAQSLDCVVEARCLEGTVCKPSETLRVEVRPLGEGTLRFQIVEGPTFTATQELLGEVMGITTDAAFGVHWIVLVGPAGDALTTAAGLDINSRLAAFHSVGRCEPA